MKYRIVFTTLFLSVFLLPNSYSQENITIINYYPSPQGNYKNINVHQGLVIGSGEFQNIPSGSIYTEAIVFNQLEDFPSNPLEGEMAWVKNQEDNTVKLWIYTGKKWEPIPFFPLTTVKIKVRTNLPEIEICGVPASSDRWKYCVLGPEIRDSYLIQNKVVVYRNCSLDSCILKIEGLSNGDTVDGANPYAEVWIETFDEGFSLSCYSDPSHCQGGYLCQHSENSIHCKCINNQPNCSNYSCNVSSFSQLLYNPQ